MHGLDINRYKRIIGVIAVLITFVLLIILIICKLYTHNKTKIIITYAPGNAELIIDNKTIKHDICKSKICNKALYVNNGKHKLELRLPNFSIDNKTFDTTSTNIVALITPINAIGQKYYDDNEFIQFQIQNASSSSFTKDSVQISHKYDFLDRLNLYGDGFIVGYGQSSYMDRDPTSIALYVNATDKKSRKKAINAIVDELEVYTSDIEIIYKNFSNPFMRDN